MKNIKNRVFKSSVVIAVCIAFVACNGETETSSGPRANADCEGKSAFVDGSCIDDAAKCSAVGSLEEVVLWSPTNASSAGEMHVTVDPFGRVHYCYYGVKDGEWFGRYGVQTNSGDFSEEEITSAGVNDDSSNEDSSESIGVRCGGIAVGEDGTAYVLSRKPAAVYVKTDSSWMAFPLKGLQGVEARGALSGDRTVISMTPSDHGWVYLGISLGYELGQQPVYLARVSPTGLEEINNGWSEEGEAGATGHAPQVFAQGGETQVVYGRLLGYQVVVGGEAMTATAQVEGAYARGSLSKDGELRVAYIDRNFQLRLGALDDWTLEERAHIGQVDPGDARDGQLPWDMVTDDKGWNHLLIEDRNQGENALVYRTVDDVGVTSEMNIVSTELATQLPGGQRYALGTDICGRPTMAVVEDGEEGLKVRILEGR